jgi:hypothetical protein
MVSSKNFQLRNFIEMPKLVNSTRELLTCNFKRSSSLWKKNTNKSILCFGLLALSEPAFNQIQPRSQFSHFRTDLEAKLSKLICNSSMTFDSFQELWKISVYDTELKLNQIDPKSLKQAIHAEKLRRAADLLAKKRHHRGHAFGVCPEGKAWIVTTPAPRAIERGSGSQIVLDLSMIPHFCREISFDHGGRDPFPVKNILRLNFKRSRNSERLVNLNLKFLSPGTVSVSCLPNDSRLGPISWFLLPVKDESSFRTPHLLAGELKTLEDFYAWMNRLRKAAKKPSLAKNPVLDEAAKTLGLHNSTVRHKRQDLLRIKNEIKQKNLEFLGENRAIGKTLSEVAWLIWHSPRHRLHLLHSKATEVGFHLSHQRNQYLLISVIAKSDSKRLMISKREKP